MSYCRWSSMNWLCDLYCYQHVDGGYTTHVAGNKVVGDVPPEPSFDLLNTEAGRLQWAAEHKAVMDWMDTAQRKPIGLAHDGETFNDPDLASFRQRLVDLRAAGYRFPDSVLAEIDEEIADEATNKTTKGQ